MMLSKTHWPWALRVALKPGSSSVGRVLVVLMLLVACGKFLVAAPPDIAHIAGEFIRLFASDSLSVDAATHLIASEGSAERQGSYWRIQSDNYSAEILLRADDRQQFVSEAELRLQVSSGLLLSDLEQRLGPWQLVFASKTSSVSFRVVSRSGNPTIVFTRLFTPNPLPDSPVLSVQLRHEGKKCEKSKKGPGANDPKLRAAPAYISGLRKPHRANIRAETPGFPASRSDSESLVAVAESRKRPFYKAIGLNFALFGPASIIAE